jgi:hypothetical protein
MPDSSKTDVLYGVGCDVVSCKYHGHDNRCYADNIVIESPTAVKRAETYCGTFTPRPSGS